MQTVAKHVLKSKMLAYFRMIEKTGENIVVTDHRRPVARIVPFKRSAPPSELFARYRGKVKYNGDLCSDTSSEWIDR